MALVESIDLSTDTVVSNFTLSTPEGKPIKSQELMGSKGLVVAFTCNHCPYAIAIWPRLIALSAKRRRCWPKKGSLIMK